MMANHIVCFFLILIVAQKDTERAMINKKWLS